MISTSTILFEGYTQDPSEPMRHQRNYRLIPNPQLTQLTKSKRTHIERKITFEKPDDEKIIEEAMKIKAYENSNRLA